MHCKNPQVILSKTTIFAKRSPLTYVLGERCDVHALHSGARPQQEEYDHEVELHDDLEVGAGRSVDGVQVEGRVVRLLDLLRALLVEDLAKGAGVPAIRSGLKC